MGAAVAATARTEAIRPVKSILAGVRGWKRIGGSFWGLL